MDSKSFKPKNLRGKTVEELQKGLRDLESELMALRVNKVSQGVASKLAKIRVVRKAVAKHLTVIAEKNRKELKEIFSKAKLIKKYNEDNKTKYSTKRLPLELRAKRTRSLRRELTKAQSSAKTLRTLKREQNFPQRRFVVKC